MPLIFKKCHGGFTLIEVMIAVALLGILQAIATSTYTSYLERVDIAQAILDMKSIEKRLVLFNLETGRYPQSLADINIAMTDPWGNPYQYMSFSANNGNGGKRKDKNLVPINSDFDLYSMGKDGDTVAPLTAKKSHDDIIRANNGSFWGLASRY